MNVMPTLVRREYQEHRALWLAPLVTALLLVGTAVFGHFEMATMKALTTDQARAILGITVWAMSLVIFIVAATVISFYLLDCLYSERRDRSILFWKSLPVSDAATVLSKFLVALVVTPIGVFLFAVITDLVVRGILTARAGAGLIADEFPLWDTGTWFKSQALLGIWLCASILWYAPLAAWMLLVSAWARRNVMMWAVLPPLVLALIERFVLHTSYVWNFISDRLAPAFPALKGMETQLATQTVTISREKVVSLPRLFDSLDISSVFFNAPMLLGLVAAVALLYVTVRLRRYRDDG